MSDTNDLSLRVRDTTVTVGMRNYGKRADLDADAIILPDDIYLSAASGLPHLIRSLAEEVNPGILSRDVRKFDLPGQAGSILVTSAGDLPARYIFHALVLDIDAHEQPRDIVPKLVTRALELAHCLNVNSLILPLTVTRVDDEPHQHAFVTQLLHLPEDDLVLIMLRQIGRYLSQATDLSHLMSIKINLFILPSADSPPNVQQLVADLAPVSAQIADWNTRSAAIYARLDHLRALEGLLDDQAPLKSPIIEAIAAELEQLAALFGEPDENQEQTMLPIPIDESLRRLRSVVADRAAASADLEQRIAHVKERLNILNQQKDTYGDLSVPPYIVLDIAQTESELKQRNAELDKYQHDRDEAQQRIDELIGGEDG